MKKTLTVLLIEDSPDFAALVQQWLSLRTDVSFVLNWTDSLQAGLDRLKNAGVDVILLDLGLPDSHGLETFNRTKLEAFGVPMILLSGDDSEHLALQMMKDGAQDYIVKGSCDGDVLAKAIQYAVARNESRVEKANDQPAADHATTVGVMGVKGGVGCTTIACNLAVELRRQTAKKTLLADLDLDGGTVGFLMAVKSKYSVLDAAAHRLDLSLWEALVSRSSDLDVLPSPSLPGVAPPDEAKLRFLLRLTGKHYGWVVADLGRPSGFSLGVVDKLTDLLLVTTTSIPALYEAKRAIDTLRKMDFKSDRLRIVVNQLPGTHQFSGSEMDQFFGLPVYAKFSAASEDLHDACIQPAKYSDFRGQMSVLARKLAGLQPEKRTSRFSRIFLQANKPIALSSHPSRAGSF